MSEDKHTTHSARMEIEMEKMETLLAYNIYIYIKIDIYFQNNISSKYSKELILSTKGDHYDSIESKLKLNYFIITFE